MLLIADCKHVFPLPSLKVRVTIPGVAHTDPEIAVSGQDIWWSKQSSCNHPRLWQHV